ncbi:MAG: DinB family protein, partial [Terriglobales bacterium]
KPVPAERSFAEQLLHAANANYFFINPALGKKVPATEDPKRSEYKTKAEVVAFVKKAFADGAAVIKQKGDKGMMNDLMVDPFANQNVRLLDMAWGLVEHSGEHYGQLVVYYRVSGMVPPESRPKK